VWWKIGLYYYQYHNKIAKLVKMGIAAKKSDFFMKIPKFENRLQVKKLTLFKAKF